MTSDCKNHGTGGAANVEPPALAVWEFAGLYVTYWCNARCAFCYVYSGPELSATFEIDQALHVWRQLDELAAKHGKEMRIHLGGGEPFKDWPLLLGMIRAARDAGLTPLEKVETNAFWARSDGLTRARLEQLDALGVGMLIVSADVYHQDFIPFERVERCVRIARQVFGRGRVRVRWWDHFNNPTHTKRLSAEEKRAAFADALERHADRMLGRAADELSDLLPLHPAQHFANERCGEEILAGAHVHIDPYGNVFPGVCSGIILGNLNDVSATGLWERLAADWRSHPIAEAVVAGGSYRLLKLARERGYKDRPGGYASKCHLCHDVRRYLFECGEWREFLGPGECYRGEATGQRDNPATRR